MEGLEACGFSLRLPRSTPDSVETTPLTASLEGRGVVGSRGSCIPCEVVHADVFIHFLQLGWGITGGLNLSFSLFLL